MSKDISVIQNSRTFITIIKRGDKFIYLDTKEKYLYWRKLINAIRETYLEETY